MSNVYKIQPKVKKVLAVENELGEKVELLIKRRTKDNIEYVGSEAKRLEKLYKEEKITPFDYSVLNVETLLENPPEGFVGSLDFDDILEVSRLVGELFNQGLNLNPEDKKKESETNSTN